MSKIEIFGFKGSTYLATVLLAGAEKGVDMDLSPLDFGKPSHFALHPFGKMPALRHGEIHLFESAAIATYIDETFDGPALQPSGPAERAVMWQWISASIDYLYGGFVSATLSHDGASEQDELVRKRGLDALEQSLGGRSFVAGETLSIADLFISPMIGFYVRSQIDEKPASKLIHADTLKNWPSVAAWVGRMESRDSVRSILEA